MTATKGTQGWRRFAGMGFELAAAVGGFAFIGWWLGGYWGSPETGLAVGAVLGIVGGLYNLVRASLIALGGGKATGNNLEE